MEKLCVFCKSFVMSPQESDWSELTPGASAEIGCIKYNGWTLGMDGEEEDFRKYIKTAETCTDYDPVDH